MRRPYTYSLGIISLALALSCGTDNGGTDATSTLIMYKVDYTTLAFEGGITLNLQQVPLPLFSEIPLEIESDQATTDEDGRISIDYEPTLDPIFQAALTNNGESNIFFPSFVAPSGFFTLEEHLTFPAGKAIQSIEGDHSQVNFAPIWEAVSDLGLTEYILDENTLVGLYLYQPNTNSEFSENWDWLLLLFRQ